MYYLKRLAFIAAAVYLVVCAYYFFRQESVIFYPTRETTEPPAHAPVSELYIDSGDGARLHAWWLDSGSDTTVLFFHGNAGNLTDRVLKVDTFRRLGFNALIWDYRGYGRSTGGIDSEQQLYEDSRIVYDHLTGSLDIPEEQIVIWGRSLGGALAVDLAAKVDKKAVVLESTFSSLDDLAHEYFWFLPYRFLLRYHFPSGEKIGQIAAPLLYVHSGQDEIVPFELGKKLFDRAAGPKQILELSGGHNDDLIVDYDRYLKGLENFFEKYN